MAKQQVTVVTATKLTPEQTRVVELELEKKLGKKYELNFVVKPKVLGGINIIVDDKEYDLTIAGRLAKLKSQLNTAEITTAIALSDEQKQQIVDRIKQKYGHLDIIEKIDQSVIGGIKIRVGSNEIDATIQTKLEKIRKTMKDQL